MIFRCATVAGTTVGSAVALAEIGDPSWIAPSLIVVVSLAAVAVVVLDIRAWRASRPFRYNEPSEIRDFMYRWISAEGRVAIYTRDMSWARAERQMIDMLRRKAAAGELTICLPRQIQLTHELERAGATIHTYRSLSFEPKSRFTIVRHGRQDAEVAIGRRIAGVHTISTYSVGQHSAFALAEDLVELTARVDEG